MAPRHDRWLGGEAGGEVDPQVTLQRMLGTDMQLTDVRRLTGASLILDRPGAVGEVVDLPDAVSGPVLALWRRSARSLLDAVGWGAESVAVRTYPAGASLAVTAPIDGLYAATDLIERAWDMVQAMLDGGAA